MAIVEVPLRVDPGGFNVGRGAGGANEGERLGKLGLAVDVALHAGELDADTTEIIVADGGELSDLVAVRKGLGEIDVDVIEAVEKGELVEVMEKDLQRVTVLGGDVDANEEIVACACE